MTAYYPTNVRRSTTATCFGNEVPSSGSYYSKGAQVNLYVLLILITTIETFDC
jgi:hypothetical protein